MAFIVLLIYCYAFCVFHFVFFVNYLKVFSITNYLMELTLKEWVNKYSNIEGFSFKVIGGHVLPFVELFVPCEVTVE